MESQLGRGQPGGSVRYIPISDCDYQMNSRMQLQRGCCLYGGEFQGARRRPSFARGQAIHHSPFQQPSPYFTLCRSQPGAHTSFVSGLIATAKAKTSALKSFEYASLSWPRIPAVPRRSASSAQNFLRWYNPIQHKTTQCISNHKSLSTVQVPDDLRKAMANLGVPNANEARAVDARQEIDLKVAPAVPCSIRKNDRDATACCRLGAVSHVFKRNSFAVASAA